MPKNKIIYRIYIEPELFHKFFVNGKYNYEITNGLPDGLVLLNINYDRYSRWFYMDFADHYSYDECSGINNIINYRVIVIKPTIRTIGTIENGADSD